MAATACLVITSIAEPTPLLRQLAADAQRSDFDLILIGDARARPTSSSRAATSTASSASGPSTSPSRELCPVGHYARKNIGYLLAHAARGGRDRRDRRRYRRLPSRSGSPPVRSRAGVRLREPGWINVYRYFSERRSGPAAFRSTRPDEPSRRLDDGLEESIARSSRASSTTIPMSTPSTGSCSSCRSGSSAAPSVAAAGRRVVPVQQPEHDLVAGGLSRCSTCPRRARSG